MPVPRFEPYSPGVNETLEGKIKGLTNAYIDTTQYLQWMLSHLDEKNVIKAQSVVADWVYAGDISTDQLIAGNAKITTALIEDLIVGGNVQMGPDATISWSQVTEQPTIPVLPDYITSTKITSTTIESPTITGGVITGGTINGGNINVDTDVYVGRYIRFPEGLISGLYFSANGSAYADPSNNYWMVFSGAIYAAGSGGTVRLDTLQSQINALDARITALESGS